MKKADETENPDWRDGFLFVGNQLALDFLNTRPIENDELVELLPDFEALLRWVRAAGLLDARDVSKLRQRWGGSTRARRVVAALRELRETLRSEVIAWEGATPPRASTINELNRLMAERPMRTRLNAEGGSPAKELWFEAEEPEDLLAPLAHSAALLFADEDPARVRKCDRCVLHFLDTSKKGNRRWCSMRLCGNRLKVAAYAARLRES